MQLVQKTKGQQWILNDLKFENLVHISFFGGV